ncbi:MAG: hypothetical protein LBE74_10085 [Treponema sp.]|nr:hypothetical protein [Treponema sp.]
MIDSFAELNSAIETLREDVESLEKGVESLSNDISGLQEKFDALGKKQEKKSDQIFILILVAVALLMLLTGVLHSILLMEIKKAKAAEKQDGRYEDKKIIPSKEPTYASDGGGDISRVAASASQTPSTASAQAGGTPKEQSPVEKPSQPPRPVDETPLLYHYKEKREKRRTVDVGDVYMDVDAAVYQRFSQGEYVKLLFEKSNNYLASPFVLVDGKLLYVNFHQFNESREISNDMRPMMAHIYDISGSLPGFVKRCVPARVVFQDNKYAVAVKGSLYMEA